MAKCNFLKVSYTLIGRKLTKTALSSQTFAGIFQKFLHQHFELSVRCCPNMSPIVTSQCNTAEAL